MKKKILFGVIVAGVLVGLVLGQIVFQFGFRQRFEIVSEAQIRVFYDVGETQELQQGNYLDWGAITSTDPQQRTLYVKNVGTVDVTLSFGYDPQSLPQDWSLTWDYDGTPLTQGTTIPVTITLTLPSTVSSGIYECNTGIQATPVQP